MRDNFKEVNESMAIKYKAKSAKVVALLLILSIGSWAPCACIGECHTATGGSEQSSSPFCCHPQSERDNESEASDEDCCCDQGLCKPDFVNSASAQSVEFGQDYRIQGDSSVGRASWLVKPDHVNPLSVHPIFPNHTVGLPFPDLSSLLI